MLEIDYLEHCKKILVVFLLVGIGNFAHSSQWTPLAKGLDYMSIQPKRFNPWSQLHVFKINLKNYSLSLAMANEYSQKTSAVNQLAHLSNALIAINGGFFNPEYEPLGLRIKNGKILNPKKNISWWGIFYVKNNQPYLVAPNQFYPKQSITFAIQGGPRLLINGRVPKLKQGIAERSAIGISKNDDVIIAVTERLPLSTTELANYLKQLQCDYALNLDGGSSSQLYANIGDFKLRVSGFSTITDAVIVNQRKNKTN